MLDCDVLRSSKDYTATNDIGHGSESKIRILLVSRVLLDVIKDRQYTANQIFWPLVLQQTLGIMYGGGSALMHTDL